MTDAMKTRSMVLAASCILAACLAPSPPDQTAPSCSAMVRWTINGTVPDDALCRGLSTDVVSVEIWENAGIAASGCIQPDGETETQTADFFVYRFDCAGGVCQNAESSGLKCLVDDDCCPDAGGCGGSGYCLNGAAKTKNFFFAGVPTCIKAALVPHPSSTAINYATVETLADSGSYLMWTPDNGSNCTLPSGEVLPACSELAPVDFALADHGPLTVGLSWEAAGPQTGQFGGCSASIPPVHHMGYALYDPAGGIVDSIQVESRSMACQDEIRWRLVPAVSNGMRGVTYSLEVWGIDESQTLQWHGTCDGLTVDGAPAYFTCEVAMAR